jgi:phenylpyruvate tautomerase PptA (4-oxalocrotonate tautomerase family)
MPVAQLYLVASEYAPETIAALLAEASTFYAAALYPEMATPPVERVRIFVTDVAPEHWATAGKPVSAGGTPAPYFSCIAMKGRPAERLRAMMAGWTELIIRHLACDGAMVRGRLIEIEPEHWYIAGTPASQLRASEIATRSSEVQ